MKLIHIVILYGVLHKCNSFSNKSLSKVIFDPIALDDPNVVSVTYVGRSAIECASMVLQQPDMWKLVCRTNTGDCLVSNKTFPANYDDESGGGGYNCFTTEKPLIDVGEYKYTVFPYLIRWWLGCR